MKKIELLEMIKEVERIASKYKLEYSLAYGTLLGAVREKGFIDWDDEIDIWIKQPVYKIFEDVLKKELSEKYEILNFNYSKYELYFSRIKLRGMDHHGLHIDVFPLVGLPESESEQKKFVDTSYFYNKLLYIKRLNARTLYLQKKRYIRYLQAIILKIILFVMPEKFILNKLNLLFNKYDVETSKKIYTFGGSYKMREVFDKKMFSNLVYTDFENTMLPIYKSYDEILTQIYGDYITPKKSNYLT